MHGLAGSIELAWRATGAIDRLAGAGLRTVAYDLRGHGRSDAPTEEGNYGDRRMVDDLIEVVTAFASPSAHAVVAGYSMGAAITLLALEAGLDVRASVIGAAPPAVLEWTPADEAMRNAAVAALRSSEPPDDEAMRQWLAFLDSVGQDRDTLAAALAGHRPVVEHWNRITVPCVFAAGTSDVMAAPLAALSERVAGSRTVTLPGDHFTAPATTEFADVIIEAAAAAN